MKGSIVLRNLFIVTDDGVFFGREKFHKDIAKRLNIPHHLVLCGGVFEREELGGRWVLFGTSYDFGKFEKEFVEMFVEQDKLFWYKWSFNSQMGNVSIEFDMEREETISDRF